MAIDKVKEEKGQDYKVSIDECRRLSHKWMKLGLWEKLSNNYQDKKKQPEKIEASYTNQMVKKEGSITQCSCDSNIHHDIEEKNDELICYKHNFNCFRYLVLTLFTIQQYHMLLNVDKRVWQIIESHRIVQQHSYTEGQVRTYQCQVK